MIKHNLDLEPLMTIYQKYVKLDIIPTHYDYPELLRQPGVPDFVQRVKKFRRKRSA